MKSSDGKGIGVGALFAAGIAALASSACCLLPLILVMLGISGSWIANLTSLEPYRPVFIGGALVALFVAYRRIFRPASACAPDGICARVQVRTAYKVIFGTVAVLALIAIAFPYILSLFD